MKTLSDIDHDIFQEWLSDNGIEVLTEDEVENLFCQSLDEEEVLIGSLKFDPSNILKELDPTAYRCGLADFSSVYQSISNTELFGGDYLGEGEDDEDSIIANYLEELNECEEDDNDEEDNDIESEQTI